MVSLRFYGGRRCTHSPPTRPAGSESGQTRRPLAARIGVVSLHVIARLSALIVLGVSCPNDRNIPWPGQTDWCEREGYADRKLALEVDASSSMDFYQAGNWWIDFRTGSKLWEALAEVCTINDGVWVEDTVGSLPDYPPYEADTIMDIARDTFTSIAPPPPPFDKICNSHVLVVRNFDPPPSGEQGQLVLGFSNPGNPYPFGPDDHVGFSFIFTDAIESFIEGSSVPRMGVGTFALAHELVHHWGMTGGNAHACTGDGTDRNFNHDADCIMATVIITSDNELVSKCGSHEYDLLSSMRYCEKYCRERIAGADLW